MINYNRINDNIINNIYDYKRKNRHINDDKNFRL